MLNVGVGCVLEGGKSKKIPAPDFNPAKRGLLEEKMMMQYWILKIVHFIKSGI